MCGALRLEPSGLSFSAGLPGRLLSLLHQCKCVLGILGRYSAGGLGLQSARVASGDTASNELHRFQGFHWACFLGWAVQHRISQWWALQGGSQNQEWVKFAALNFCFVAVSSLWVLALTHSLWNKKPRTRIQPFLPHCGEAFSFTCLSHLHSSGCSLTQYCPWFLPLRLGMHSASLGLCSLALGSGVPCMQKNVWSSDLGLGDGLGWTHHSRFVKIREDKNFRGSW
jgi:hypothetical protein